MSDNQSPRLQYPDGTPVPTFDEVNAQLGAEFVAVADARLARMNASRNPQEITQLGANLQGMWSAAAILGHVDKRVAKGMLMQTVLMTDQLVSALGVPTSVQRPIDLQSAQVH